MNIDSKGLTSLHKTIKELGEGKTAMAAHRISTAPRREHPQGARQTLPRYRHPEGVAGRNRQRPGTTQEGRRTGAVQRQAQRVCADRADPTRSSSTGWPWGCVEPPQSWCSTGCAASGRHRQTLASEHRFPTLQRGGHQGITEMLRGRHHQRHTRLPLTSTRPDKQSRYSKAGERYSTG